MRAFVLERVADVHEEESPLRLMEVADPRPGAGEVLLRVAACGVCHTELDEIEGRVRARMPVIPGHQVVGRVATAGPGAKRFRPGDRVGVAWIFHACGRCRYCLDGLENLCPDFLATGADVHGGYGELMKVHEDFVHPIPPQFSDVEAAPLLCAGAIGYRALELTGLRNGERIGLTGFGGSGHLVLKMVRHRFPDSAVYVFARNPAEQEFARELGAAWAGNTDERAPEALRAIIDTTPAWGPVVSALENLAPGGRLVINAIRKEERDKERLMDLDYARNLWLEREVKSVANITRGDVAAFLSLAAEISLRPHVEVYPFEEANRALRDLRMKKIRGAKVLHIA
ncbi:MAG: zinc-dependent alcohol dehydrogenase family protein [Desulfobulbaceae bacterium]